MRLSITFRPEQAKLLRAIAKQEHMPIALVVRRVVDAGLAVQRAPRKPRVAAVTPGD